MFNIGSGELVLIAVVALLVLGPKRLPELARGLGKFLREFRRQTDQVRNVVEREFYKMDHEMDGPPPPPPARLTAAADTVPVTWPAPAPPSAVEGPVPSAVEGPVPSAVEGPVPSAVEGTGAVPPPADPAKQAS